MRGDDAAREVALSLIDHLGRCGHQEFRKLLPRGGGGATAPADRLWQRREHHVDRHGQRGGQPRLNDHFGLAFLDELIARKVCGENASVEGLDWPFHEARLTELEAQLDRAFAESPLPEDRDRNAINDVLVGLRLRGNSREVTVY